LLTIFDMVNIPLPQLQIRSAKGTGVFYEQQESPGAWFLGLGQRRRLGQRLNFNKSDPGFGRGFLLGVSGSGRVDRLNS
jgi:hypothetical protein